MKWCREAQNGFMKPRTDFPEVRRPPDFDQAAHPVSLRTKDTKNILLESVLTTRKEFSFNYWHSYFAVVFFS